MKDEKQWDEYYENNGVHAINMDGGVKTGSSVP